MPAVTIPRSPGPMEGLFNISESDETIIRSPINKEKRNYCLGLPTMRQHEIKHINGNLEARQATIAQIEESINRIRESMSTNSSDSGDSHLPLSESGSICGSDSTIGILDLHSRSSETSLDGSRSQALRQKVREKETALHQYIQKNSGVMDEMRMRRAQVQNLVSAMEEKETVSEKLRAEVARLGKEIEECQEKAREEMTKQRLTAVGQLESIERKVEAKEEQVNYYEFKLQAKDQELSTMREELEEATRRVVELEVDLETHDIRFASHEEYIRQVDAVSLEMPTDDDGPTRDGSTVRHEKYTKKLIAELSDMERRYMEEKTSSLLQISALEKDNKACRASLLSLARHLAVKNNGGSDGSQANPLSPGNNPLPSPSSPSHDDSAFSRFQPNSEYTRKRMELLENENIGHVGKIKSLKSELKNVKSELNEKKEKKDKELAWMQLENQSLTVKMAELEQDLNAASRYPEQVREYSLLEKKLDQSVVEILNLVEKVYAKDRIISSLRSKLVEQRLDGSGTIERTSAEQRLSLKSHQKHPEWIDDVEQGSGGMTADETDTSYVFELQSQLQECQRKLREKEQELNRIREKSDSQAVKLQTRLQESKQPLPGPDLYFV